MGEGQQATGGGPRAGVSSLPVSTFWLNHKKPENAALEIVLPSCYEGTPVKVREHNALF